MQQELPFNIIHKPLPVALLSAAASFLSLALPQATLRLSTFHSNCHTRQYLPGRSGGTADHLRPGNNCRSQLTWLHFHFLISIDLNFLLLRDDERHFRPAKNKYYTKLAIGAPAQNLPGRIQIFLAINTAPTHSPNIYAKKIWSAPMPNG